ncbi:hypothetical protein F5Y17DRAFT_448762 [Xylariaceae sp. FL0594]|nr:hypothetical protein F5Y17DRAFT_448762 [Xylariaceae sp. FL0594]
MAGYAPEIQFPNPSSFFNIYTDAPPQLSSSPGLPGGPCHYVDLSHGPNGQKCGCRRFWKRSPLGGGPYDEQEAWCMCSHHACFHDDAKDSQPAAASPFVVASVHANGQENERPRTNREPLTPVMPELSFKFTKSFGQQQMDYDAFAYPGTDAGGSVEASLARGMEEPPRTSEIVHSSLPDTLDWTSHIQPGSNRSGSLAPIPSQCLLPSQPSSTTSSTRIAYLKPFAGRGLQTLSGVQSKAIGHVEPKEDEPVDAPDVADTDDDDEVEDDTRTVTNTPRSTRHAGVMGGEEDQSPARDVTRSSFHLLSATVKGHDQRLENLENVSFSAAAHDACSEKHDLADLRVTELESRVEEVEKILNDSSSTVTSHRRGVDDATASVVSASTSASIADRENLYHELQCLKAQLSQLQGLPSPSNPWQVEVVFLPFPLKNVWLDQREIGSQRLSTGSSVEPDLWTQLPSALEPPSPGFGDWMGPEVDADWLVGRACAPDNLIAQRLKSRGLVKNVVIRGPDAHSVHQAMSEAFGSLFRTFSRMQGAVHHGSTAHPRVAKFLGLQSPWIPLRKVRKESRLRFLSPAEMVTPVSWDFQFLASSVVMKSHQAQRLFITHPEAYLQDLDAYENGWTWQRLRELSRVYADSQNSQEIPEGDALEDCWVWNSVLDEPLTPGSLSARAQDVQRSAQDHWRAMSSSTPRIAPPFPTPSLTVRRTGSRAQSPAVLQQTRQPSRPPRPPLIRTHSLPPALHEFVPPSFPKRRVTSHGHPYERHAMPRLTRISQRVGPVKRRFARSPSFQPRLNRYISPRWSSSSPSPMPEAFGQQGTAHFYATPHSNATYMDTWPNRDRADDDDDEDSDFAMEEDGIDVYDEMDEDVDDVDDDDDDDDDGDDSSMVLGRDSSQTNESSQNGQAPEAPEDEPWPGIEDEENFDPDAGVGIDIYVDNDVVDEGEEDEDSAMVAVEEDTQSEGSSAPSEYPSTEPPWITSGRSQEFRVFKQRGE